MFFCGSIQEGISSAVGKQKLVLCFVTDGQEESEAWETEYLQHEILKPLIETEAVALRLQAGSDEAGYLAQIFPLPKTPTIVIMKHGELKEYIAAGTTKDDFFRRVQTALGSTVAATSSTQASPTAAPRSTLQPPSSPAAGLSSSPESDRSENVRRVLAERAAQRERDEAEGKAKAEKAQAQKAAEQQAEEESGDAAARREALDNKRREDMEEKLRMIAETKRIRKKIKDDQEQRRMTAAEREQQRAGIVGAERDISTLGRASNTRVPEMTSIQVRLLDGATLRSKFKTSSPVADIRKWVDEERTDGDLPYKFKQVLTPLPNRNIDVAEENKSIEEAGLTPSSTLLLIPIPKFAGAYSGESMGLASRIMAMIFGIFGFILRLFGGGRPRETAPTQQQIPTEQQQPSTGSSAAKNQRIRGFDNPEGPRRDHQLYNGNSLNFEPRPDDEEEK